MKAIVLGSGRVGCGIAQYLSFTGNDITVVSPTNEVVKKLGDTMDVQPVVGEVCHPDTLIKAGLKQSDVLIAVTHSDEMNLLSCSIAKKLGFKGLTIARIRSEEYVNTKGFNPHQIDVDVIITPEVEIAETIYRSIQIIGAFDVLSLGDMKVVGVKCPQQAPLLNTPLRLVQGIFQHIDWVVLCIKRHNEIIFPKGEDSLLPHDEIYFLAKNNDVSKIMEALGFPDSQTHKVLVVGSGPVGLNLAKYIEENNANIQLTVVEKNTEKAQHAAEKLENATVLNGNVLDQDILLEAQISQTEVAITITNDDNVNVLSSIMAKQMGCKRAISLINNTMYNDFVSALKVDTVINPNNIIISTIIRAVRQGHLQSLLSFYGVAELLTARVTETSHIIGVDIDSIIIDDSIIVAGIIRNNEIVFMPSQTIIQINDTLLLVVRKEKVHDIEAILAPHITVSTKSI